MATIQRTIVLESMTDLYQLLIEEADKEEEIGNERHRLKGDKEAHKNQGVGIRYAASIVRDAVFSKDATSDQS